MTAEPTTRRIYYGHHRIPGYEISHAAHHDSIGETIAAGIAAAIRQTYEAAARGTESLDATTLNTLVRYAPGTDDLTITTTANASPRRERE